VLQKKQHEQTLQQEHQHGYQGDRAQKSKLGVAQGGSHQKNEEKGFAQGKHQELTDQPNAQGDDPRANYECDQS
jgi:hypothetical protein